VLLAQATLGAILFLRALGTNATMLDDEVILVDIFSPPREDRFLRYGTAHQSVLGREIAD
jgi:hypothetical protein